MESIAALLNKIKQGCYTFLVIFGLACYLANMKGELTAAQVSERLGVGRSTVNLWCRRKRFPNARIEKSPVGDYWLIPESDLKDFEPPKMGRPSTKKAAKKGSKK